MHRTIATLYDAIDSLVAFRLAMDDRPGRSAVPPAQLQIEMDEIVACVRVAISRLEDLESPAPAQQQIGWATPWRRRSTVVSQVVGMSARRWDRRRL